MTGLDSLATGLVAGLAVGALDAGAAGFAGALDGAAGFAAGDGTGAGGSAGEGTDILGRGTFLRAAGFAAGDGAAPADEGGSAGDGTFPVGSSFMKRSAYALYTCSGVITVMPPI